jgi:hypothetical protein
MSLATNEPDAIPVSVPAKLGGDGLITWPEDAKMRPPAHAKFNVVLYGRETPVESIKANPLLTEA